MRDILLANIEVVFEPDQAPAAFDAVLVVLFAAGKLVLVKNDRRFRSGMGGNSSLWTI